MTNLLDARLNDKDKRKIKKLYGEPVIAEPVIVEEEIEVKKITKVNKKGGTK